MCCCSCCILHEVWKKKKCHVYLGCISGSSPASLGCPNKLGREQILMRIPTWLSATCPFGLWLWGLFDILSLQHSAAPSHLLASLAHVSACLGCLDPSSGLSPSPLPAAMGRRGQTGVPGSASHALPATQPYCCHHHKAFIGLA